MLFTVCKKDIHILTSLYLLFIPRHEKKYITWTIVLLSWQESRQIKKLSNFTFRSDCYSSGHSYRTVSTGDHITLICTVYTQVRTYKTTTYNIKSWSAKENKHYALKQRSAVVLNNSIHVCIFLILKIRIINLTLPR